MPSPSRIAALALIPLFVAAPTAVASTRTQSQPVQDAARPAQPRPRQAPAPAPAAPATVSQLPLAQNNFDAEETRQQLDQLLRQFPPSLAEVLRLDPSMLSNDAYLATYPALGAFLAQHPEVAHNPAYFVGSQNVRSWNDNTPQMEAIRMWQELAQNVSIVAVVLTITSAFVWLIRLLLDYRKWLRLSKTQTEVHTKLLDRFASNDDLLAYIQTPSGRRFLDSAPITLDSEPARTVSAPVNRILWSVQVGIILAAGAAGLMFVSGRQMPEIGQPMSALGSIGMALGAGFVVSALISYLLSKRLGLVNSAQPAAQGDGGSASV
jgi:hypothetical protein